MVASAWRVDAAQVPGTFRSLIMARTRKKTVTSTETLWTRATDTNLKPNRTTSGAPACGPVAVTTVPVTIATNAHPTTRRWMVRTLCGTSRSTRETDGMRELRSSMNAHVTSAMDTRKWVMFAHGFRPVTTTIAPMTIWATTPATSPHARSTRSLRRGFLK